MSADIVAAHGSSGQLFCSADELRTLFLFEKLTDEQLQWLCERGHVELIGPGPVYAEGAPATCFYVLLEGTVVMSRRVGADDIEIGRTSLRGVYSGAFMAYLGDRVPQVYNNSLRVTEPSRFFVLDASVFAELMHGWFPMAVHLLEGLFYGNKKTQEAIGQRERLLALGSLSAGLTHELNNPAAAAVRATASLRERVAGMRHKLGMIAGGRWDRTTLETLIRLQEEAAERVPKALALSPLEAVRPGGRHLGLAGRARRAGRLGYGADVRSGRAGYRLARTRRGDGGAGDPRGRAAVAELHGRDRTADERDRGLHYPDLHPGRRGQAVLAAGPGAVPGRRRARTAGQHAADAVREDPARDSRGKGLLTRSLPPIPAYAAELNQVWTNLIDNAVSAMNGAGTLTVRTGLDRDQVFVEFGDTGPGVPPEIKDRIFEPFFTTKPVGEGTGLGLDISWRIVVNKHHGDLSLQSSPGDTRFRVRLPITAQDDA